jgi:hypothetical protein
VDLLEVNGHRVCTVARIGIVAATGVQMARLMAPGSAWRLPLRSLGAFAYMGAAALELLLAAHVTAPATVRWRETSSDWSEVTSEVHGVFLANLATLGAGLRLPVPGRSDDGQIEVVRLPRNPRVRLLRGLARLRSGRPLPDGLIDVKRATEAEIEAGRQRCSAMAKTSALRTLSRPRARSRVAGRLALMRRQIYFRRPS